MGVTPEGLPNAEGKPSVVRAALRAFVQHRTPTGRRPVGGALAPVAAVTSSHQGLPVGCLWFTHDLSGAWQGRNGDHVWEKRCSRLDLLGCDPGPGTAPGVSPRGKQNWRLALCSYGMTLAPRHRVHLNQTLAPPLCAPARVLPGRTLVEGEGRVGFRASPQVQITPLFSWRWPAGVPLAVPGKTQSVPCF